MGKWCRLLKHKVTNVKHRQSNEESDPEYQVGKTLIFADDAKLLADTHSCKHHQRKLRHLHNEQVAPPFTRYDNHDQFMKH